MRITGYIPQKMVELSPKTGSVTAAIRAFRLSYPEAHIETIRGKTVVGWDEGSGVPIYDGDQYGHWDDGPVTLIKRGKKKSSKS